VLPSRPNSSLVRNLSRWLSANFDPASGGNTRTILGSFAL
jgi:hypothetical protein